MENLNVMELDSKELLEINGGGAKPGPIALIGIIHEAYDFYEGIISGWNKL